MSQYYKNVIFWNVHHTINVCLKKHVLILLLENIYLRKWPVTVIINHLGDNINNNNEFNSSYFKLAQFQIKPEKQKIQKCSLWSFSLIKKKILVREMGFIFE